MQMIVVASVSNDLRCDPRTSCEAHYVLRFVVSVKIMARASSKLANNRFGTLAGSCFYRVEGGRDDGCGSSGPETN
eukprot:7052887-Alexandrium_andersonii.AAC.1